MKTAETFAVPLYEITSNQKLEELVVNRLITDTKKEN